MRAVVLSVSLLFGVGTSLAQSVPSNPQAEIETFNKQLENATRAMNNPALMALWADDGISLLPSAKPLIGKLAIAAFLNQVTAQLKGARMEKFEMQCCRQLRFTGAPAIGTEVRLKHH